MQAVFQFEKLHTVIRRQSRQNRKNRLDTFLAESVPFVLQNKLHDWYKRIRTLCPKHSFRRIQLFDMHGAPLSQAQELERLTQYYQELFTDSQAPIMTPPALNQLPFTEADVLHELQHLPVTKALSCTYMATLCEHSDTSDVSMHQSGMVSKTKVYPRHIGLQAGSTY